MNGKEEAFVQLVEEHSGILFKVIHLYVDDEEDRRDLHQEILIQVWKSFDKFRRQSKFSTWLYRVALNTTLTYQKREGRHKAVIEKIDPVASEEVQTNEVKDYLYRLVKQLDDIDRMIMTLHLDSYSNTEIAEITGMKVNHINVKLHRLKNKIVEQLKGYTYGSN